MSGTHLFLIFSRALTYTKYYKVTYDFKDFMIDFSRFMYVCNTSFFQIPSKSVQFCHFVINDPLFFFAEFGVFSKPIGDSDVSYVIRLLCLIEKLTLGGVSERIRAPLNETACFAAGTAK